MRTRIPYTKPSITDREVAYATDAAAHGWGERCYEYIARFEAAFREFTGAPYAISTASATGALHMGLAALGIGPGDEVILADTNWIASVAPIQYLGATPVFVDIDPDTWCLDPDRVAAAVTPRTRAIIAVHLYGNVCALERLLGLGDRLGIPVIEDAAEAIGSTWQGRQVGTFGRFGVFSFHGTKTVTTGEGGMFVTRDQALYEQVLTLSNHGRRAGETRQFWPEVVGFKYKLSNIQAAIGCAQMERVEELIARKRAVFRYYEERLQIPGIRLNPEPPGTRNGYWMPTLVASPDSGVTRERLLAQFQADGIDGRVFFHPLSSLPMFRSCPGHVHAYGIAGRALNLPSYHDLLPEEQDRVIEAVLAVVNRYAA